MYDLDSVVLVLNQLLYYSLNPTFFPVSKKDQNYEATRLHFENLAKRYGNPIIILNLIKVLGLNLFF